MVDIILLIFTALVALIYSFFHSQPAFATHPILEYLRLVMVFGGALVLVRIIIYLFVDWLWVRLSWTQPSRLLRFLIIITLYGITIALYSKLVLQVDIVAVLTATAVMSVILGLALQATLGNVFSGIALSLERPFRVGDDIKVGGESGEVELFSWRSIFIRTFYGSLLVYPNSKIMSEVVEVFPANQDVGHLITIPVPTTVPPQTAIKIIHEVIRTVPNLKADLRPLIQIDKVTFDTTQAGPWVTLYRVIYHPLTARIAAYTDATIKERVWYAFSRNGIDRYVDNRDSVERTRRHLDLIASNPIFRDIGRDEKEAISRYAISRLYAAGEPVFAPSEAKYSMFIICRGTLNVQSSEIPAAGPDIMSEDTLTTYETSNPIWQPQILERISSEFADYIGPIADHLVEQSASKTSDLYLLYHILAREIDDMADRASFLTGSPSYPVVQLKPGDFFGELPLFTGTPAMTPAMEAAEEVELLELRPPALAKLLANNTGLASVFSDRLAEYRASVTNPVFGSEQSEVPLTRHVLLERINSFYHLGSDTP